MHYILHKNMSYCAKNTEKEAEMFKILMEELWNESTERTMKEARRLCEDRSIVGVLGDRVFTYLVAKGQSTEETVKGCQDHMTEARSTMPDFTYQPLEDCGLVYLNNGLICTYLTKEEARWGEHVPKDDVFELLIYRAMAQEAAENNNVIAVWIPETVTAE